MQCLSRPRFKKSCARSMCHEQHIQKCRWRRHDSPRSPCRMSDCKSQGRTTETTLAHVVYRQSHHNWKTPAPLSSSLTCSTPQQHGKARFAASKHRCCTRRIAPQGLAHDSPFACRNTCFSASSKRGLSIRTRKRLSPLSLLGADAPWTKNETAERLCSPRDWPVVNRSNHG